MEHCRDCRWFTPDEHVEEYDLKAAADAGWTMYGLGWGTCDLAMSSSGGPYRGEHPQTLALAVDASTYSAVLSVSPEFGCVQWTPARAEDQAAERHATTRDALIEGGALDDSIADAGE